MSEPIDIHRNRYGYGPKWRQLRRAMLGGGQPCCGATNEPCARPPGVVNETPTGCEKCGHPKSCHAFTWANT